MELNKFYIADSVKFMSENILNDFIDVTITSPPYDDLRQYKGYVFDFENMAKELYRVTKQGGIVVWIVGDKTDRGSETGTSFKQALYFKEVGLNPGERPHILSEFGGYSHIVENHCYSLYHQHGYGFFDNQEALTGRIVSTYEKMVLPAISKGLCGSVYTQLSDVEDEVNGLYTYDRKILKVDKAKMNEVKMKIDRQFCS
jgi:hypothetical protein